MPRIVRSRALLPDPDSPMIASTRAGRRVKDTSFTARSGPAWVLNSVVRWRTSRSGASSCARSTGAGTAMSVATACLLSARKRPHRDAKPNERRSAWLSPDSYDYGVGYGAPAPDVEYIEAAGRLEAAPRGQRPR